MQAMSAIKIQQTRHTQLTPWMGFHAGNVSNQNTADKTHTQLTSWMGFHAGNVSNQNTADKAHTTHILDGISCRQCQQSKYSRQGTHNSRAGWDFMQAMSAIKIQQTRHTQLTSWMGFHAGNVSNHNTADKAHTTHSLDGISCRQCQQSKYSRQGTHNSLPGWDFMQAMSAIKIQQTRHTQLTPWMGFHAGNVSNQNTADKAHMTHSLDGISCRHFSTSNQHHNPPIT